MKKLILGAALAAAAMCAWALPTLQEVETQVQQGHYAQAETMMREVVAAKPNSARAHYVYAEILAHDGKFALARDEAKLARQIDPDVKFESADKFNAFEALLQRQSAEAAQPRTTAAQTRPALTNQAAPAAIAPATAAAGIPGWVWIAGLAAIAFFLWRGFSRSRAAAVGGAATGGAYGAAPAGAAPVAPYGGAPYGAAPYGAGYPPARPGTGMLGVGLAAAGGVAAGMLAEQMLNRGHNQNLADDSSGGGQPGFFESPQGGAAANELESRPVDFGTGGGDWDAGSSDAGSGGGDGGGWD